MSAMRGRELLWGGGIPATLEWHSARLSPPAHASRTRRAPALLKLKPILQFFQQLIDLLRRFLRRSFLAVTQLNLDPKRQR